MVNKMVAIEINHLWVLTCEISKRTDYRELRKIEMTSDDIQTKKKKKKKKGTNTKKKI